MCVLLGGEFPWSHCLFQVAALIGDGNISSSNPAIHSWWHDGSSVDEKEKLGAQQKDQKDRGADVVEEKEIGTTPEGWRQSRQLEILLLSPTIGFLIFSIYWAFYKSYKSYDSNVK